MIVSIRTGFVNADVFILRESHVSIFSELQYLSFMEILPIISTRDGPNTDIYLGSIGLYFIIHNI